MNITKYKLSPSASERFLICTASIKHQNAFEESKWSVLGNLQHEVAFLRLAQLFKGEDNQKEIDKLTDPNNEYKTSNGKLTVKWTNTCDKNVDEYVSYIKKLHKKFNPKILFLEYKFNFMFYGYKMFGTADVAMVLDNMDVVIVDLKTGRNKVETEDNPQMLLYGMGFVQEIIKKLKKTPQNVYISVAQPLAYNMEIVKYSITQVARWYNSLAIPMDKINNNKLTYTPHKKACKYCDYSDECMARFEKGIY